MAQQVDIISANFIEKDLLNVNFAEKELIRADFKTIDILHYLEKYIINGLIQEVPIKLSSSSFQTSKPFITGSIKFYLNGLKEKQLDIIETNATIFEITEEILIDDDFEVEYLELI